MCIASKLKDKPFSLLAMTQVPSPMRFVPFPTKILK
jgi:hypothetical protein